MASNYYDGQPCKSSFSSSSSSSSLSFSDHEEESHDQSNLSNLQYEAAIIVPVMYKQLQQNYVMLQQTFHDHTPHGGSKKGRVFKYRNHTQAYQLLQQKYFNDHTTYKDKDFSRRYRMSKILFNRIYEAVCSTNSFFVQKYDAAHRPGPHPKVKVTAAMRLLSTAVSADFIDEFLTIGEQTVYECLKEFCKSIIGIFGERYLRSPNKVDIARILHDSAERGWPGCLGSLDCMHWHWKNCPVGWHGTHIGHKKVPTVILEVVATFDNWIWHSFFGMAGSHNDINVLDHSPLFNDFKNGETPPCNFVVNGRQHNVGYYLADGIYKGYSTLIQSIADPKDEKEVWFAQRQEATRKEVECTFGILQARFKIVKEPSRFWSLEIMHQVMKTCIILNNMIVEESPENNRQFILDQDDNSRGNNDVEFNLGFFIARSAELRSKTRHNLLKRDLIEHQWSLRGNRRAGQY